MTLEQAIDRFRKNGVPFEVQAEVGGGVTVSARGEIVSEGTLLEALKKLAPAVGIPEMGVPVMPMKHLERWCLDRGLIIKEMHSPYNPTRHNQ